MMKNLLIGAALWGFFFAPVAHAVDKISATFQGIWQGGSSLGQYYNVTPSLPSIIYVTVDPEVGSTGSLNLYLHLNHVFTRTIDGKTVVCEVALNSNITCPTVSAVHQIRWSSPNFGQNFPETQTCNFYAGDKFFNKNQSQICADTGGGTGGPNSKPLLCVANYLGGTNTGNNEGQFEFTATQCSSVTPDPEPDPNPDPDPDPNPDPDPEPDPGTPGGGTSPTSGTTGGTTGTSGSNPVNLVMDFKPVTERLDLLRADTKAHTNYLGQRINDASAAGVAATNSLKPLLEAIATKTDGVSTAIREGNAEIKGELTTLNNTGKAIEGAIKDGNTALGEKLDGIKEGIDKLTEGEPIDGTAAGNNVALPDYDTAVRDGVQQIQSTVNQYAADSGINDLTDRQAVTGMFEAAQSFADVFDIARSQCNPIAFGSRGTFNVCGAAPTISMVLEIIIWALTALFIFHFIGGLLTRERLT